jgi:hypothetical protein
MSPLIESIFSTPWTFFGTAFLVALMSFSGALTFYWLTRYKELMQDKIIRELEIARLERYEFEKLLTQLSVQDPFQQ